MSRRLETPPNEPLLFLFLGATIALAGVAVGWYGRRLAVERDPVLHAFLTAPLDDEPTTPEDLAAIAEAETEMARGEVVPWAEVKRTARRTSA
jgi:hypothetical protein